MAKKLSIEDAFGFGWETFKSNAGYFLALTILAAVAGSLTNLPEFLAFSGPFFAVLYVVFTLISYTVSIGVIHIYLRFTEGEKPGIMEVFSKWNLLVVWIAGSILFGLAVLIPVLLIGAGIAVPLFKSISLGTIAIGAVLVVAGFLAAIYVSLMLLFYNFYIVDRELSVWRVLDAFRYSRRLTAGVKLRVLLFFVVSAAVNFLGLLALIVGLLVTIPVTGLALAHFYRQLEERAGG